MYVHELKYRRPTIEVLLFGFSIIIIIIPYGS